MSQSKQSKPNIAIINVKAQDLKNYVQGVQDKTTNAEDFCQYLKEKHKSTATTIIADLSGQTFSNIDLSNIDLGNIIATRRKVGKEQIEHPTQFQNCNFNNTNLRSTTSMQGLEFTHCKMENLSFEGDLNDVTFGVGSDISNLNLMEAYNIDKCIIAPECKISQVILGFPDRETFERDMGDKIDLQKIEQPSHRRTDIPLHPAVAHIVKPAPSAGVGGGGGITGFLGRRLWGAATGVYNTGAGAASYITSKHSMRTYDDMINDSYALEQTTLHENALKRILDSKPSFSPSIKPIKESDKVILTRVDIEEWIGFNTNQKNKVSLKDYIVSLTDDETPGVVIYMEKLDLKSLNFSNLECGEVIMSQCDFSHSRFDKVVLDLVYARDCNFSDVVFNEVSAKNANFTRSVFCGAKIDKTSFENTIMIDADFSAGTLSTEISNSNLDYSDMRSATLNGTLMKNTSLINVNMQDVIGNSAILLNVTISESNLSGAKLPRIAMKGSKIKDTIAHNANFEDAIMDNVEITALDAHKINFNGMNAQNLTITKSDLSHGTMNNTTMAGGTIKDSIMVNVQGQQLKTYIDPIPAIQENETEKRAKAELVNEIEYNQSSEKNETPNVADKKKLEQILQKSMQLLMDPSQNVVNRGKLAETIEEAKQFVIDANYSVNNAQEFTAALSAVVQLAQDNSYEIDQKEKLVAKLSSLEDLTKDGSNDITGWKELIEVISAAKQSVNETNYDIADRKKLAEDIGEAKQFVIETNYDDSKKEELIEILGAAQALVKDNSNDIAIKDQLIAKLQSTWELLTDKSYNIQEVEKINRELESQKTPQGLEISNTDVRALDLAGSHLVATTLNNVDAQHAKMQNIVVENSEIQNSNLHGADISGAEFHNTMIENNNFTDVNGQNVAMSGGTFKNDDISGANLTHAAVGIADAKVDMEKITADYATNLAHTTFNTVDPDPQIQLIQPDAAIKAVDSSDLVAQSEVQEAIMANTPTNVASVIGSQVMNVASNIAYYTGGIAGPIKEGKKSRLGMFVGSGIGIALGAAMVVFTASTFGVGLLPIGIIAAIAISGGAIGGGFCGNFMENNTSGRSIMTLMSTGFAAVFLGPAAAAVIPAVVLYNAITGQNSPIRNAVGSVIDIFIAKPMQAIAGAMGKVAYSAKEVQDAQMGAKVREKRQEKVQIEIKGIRDISPQDVHTQNIALAQQNLLSAQHKPTLVPQIGKIPSKDPLNPGSVTKVKGKWIDNIPKKAKDLLSTVSKTLSNSRVQTLQNEKSDNSTYIKSS